MRRALCVGIDHYPGGSLDGCVSDAERIADVLAKHWDDSPNFDCSKMVAPNPGDSSVVTRATLRRAVEELFEHQAEVALFHFSGHGTVNKLDGVLVTQDAKRWDEGVPMSQVLTAANKSPATEVVILLDCCYAGNFGNPPAVDNEKVMLREGVSILTASRGDQPSVEAGGGGVFTSLVVDALAGGAADLRGEVTAPAVYACVETALGAWDQRPLFKSHVSKLLALRKCKPAIDPSILRRLPEYFVLPAEELPLDPAYEEESSSPDPQKVSVFKDLQRLSRVHLVIPVDADHMYGAAMNSKACRLTDTGCFYWRLAKVNRI